MAWEIVAGYLAEKALATGTRMAAKGARLFAERLARGWRAPLAERYLSLSAQEQLALYSKDAPIVTTLAGQDFLLPASLAYSPKRDGDLQHQDISFLLSSNEFVLDEALDDYQKPVRRAAERDKRLFDGKVIRLASLAPDGLAMLEPASYFDALVTNFAMDHRPSGRTESLRDFLHGQTRSVGDFNGNKLVNHLGIVCMIETADGKLLAQQRSAKVANRPRSISASVSGAVNLTDVRLLETQTFGLPALAGAVFRETFEELGVEPRETRFLGLLREFLRGGKPEIYFYARSSASTDRVIARRKKAEGRAETRSVRGLELYSERVGPDDASRYAFQQRTHRILEDVGKSANLTFVAGVLLVNRYVLQRAA